MAERQIADELGYTSQDIVARLREQAQAPALAWLADAADEIERLRDLCYEAQEFITHDKNCGALMGWAKDCSCGYDEMWRKLNV